MPVPTGRLNVALGKEEAAMLRQLAKATGKTKPEVVRELIVGAYAKLVPKLKARAGFGFAGVLLPVPASKKKKSPPKKV